MSAPLRFLVAAFLTLGGGLVPGCKTTPRDAGDAGAVVAPRRPEGPLQAARMPPAFSEPHWQRAPGPPLTLTASDGSGLELVSLTARAVVADPLAFTELHLAFKNPRPRTVEGTFSITLSPKASIARFAMRTGEVWQEGEVVEKQAARRAYEDFLHRKQDPALLEQAAGNQFSARVFPIPGSGEKELIVSYTEELAAGTPYALALKGLPEVADLVVSVTGNGLAEQEVRETKTTPAGDLVFERAAPPEQNGLRSGSLVAVRVKPLGDAPSAVVPLEGLLVLVDTSGSRALGFLDQLKLVQDLVTTVAAKEPSIPLRVAAYDQSVASIFDGKASAFGDREIDALKERSALGASNLDQALEWTHAHLGSIHRVVVVTDGVLTAGETDAEPLRSKVAGLRSVGAERFDVIGVGGIRDDAVLKGLVTGGLPKDGIVADIGMGATRIAEKLGAPTRSGIAVQIEGATFSYPTKLDGVQPGDDAVVFAEVGDAKEVRVAVDGSAPVTMRLGDVDAPLLERAVAGAKIDALESRELTLGRSPELQAQIINLAVSHRVVTPYTALLVLETDADFARYDITRRGLANILAVQDGQLVSTSRLPLVPTRAKAEDPPKGAVTPAMPLTRAFAPTPAPVPTQAAGAASPAASAPAVIERLEELPPTAAPPGAPEDRREAVATVPQEEAARAPSAAAVPEPAAAPSPHSRPLAIGPGRGDAPDLGGIGTLGSGAGGGGNGFGNGHGRLGGSSAVAAPAVQQVQADVRGSMPAEVVQRVIRQSFGRFRQCYESALTADPALQGDVSVRFVIDRSGAVESVSNAGSSLANSAAVACVIRGFHDLAFPVPVDKGTVTVSYALHFSPGNGGGSSLPPKPPAADPYTGPFRDVMDRIAQQDVKGATGVAEAWHEKDPGDILALVALGESLEASHDPGRAARAYGSIIDLFPARADLRRFAGSRLERIKVEGADRLALDTYAKAVVERPDHPSSHRLLAYALLKSGSPAQAFDAAAAGLARRYPESRFPGVHRILQEDVGLIAAAWIKAEPNRKTEIMNRVHEIGGTVEASPSLRFVLTWETDANDVDFHIYDAAGGHAFYAQKHLGSGGDLYADITTGYGPECFTIRGPRAGRSSQYRLQANYYSRGPMGYGMGKLEVIDHDGEGGLTFDERPYVVMVDHAFVDLGVVKR